ncbi:beta-ketoacyl-ACP synthase III [Waltera sp.]|uniref:beta-ketoacyl-ACP synthase III n=1 Tax=Waltera sp. TaxID=2815806 RepID=UPI003079155A
MRTIRITGTGSALPGRIVTNKELEQMVETSDEWIRERTGIGERHVSVGETVVTLGSEAACKALEQAGKRAEEIDLILVATCSPEQYLPCCACQVQAAIGAVNALAFDVNAACSGFLFALNTADAYLRTGLAENALVIGSEVLSKLVDWTDRGSCILFGDGAGAVVVERCEASPGILGRALHSDGTGGGVLQCGARELTTPYARTSAAKTDQKQQTDDREHYIQMDGQEVYRFATRRVPQCIEEALADAGLAVPDIDLFVLHQANARIIDAVAKRLHADREKFPTNLERVGNLSSASIPVLLDELHRQGKLHRGDRIVLAGFGAGLTIGACVMTW